jgi:hypothetical protein
MEVEIIPRSQGEVRVGVVGARMKPMMLRRRLDEDRGRWLLQSICNIIEWWK